jgi:N-acetylglucosaminyldiphosphoundecaprenol N-acetyl-beta-D-mannosaminyltransferase
MVMACSRRRICGIDIDAVDQSAAVREILEWCRRQEGGIVVTPNLDHVMQLRGNAAFRGAYGRARLVLADGAPLVWLSRIGGPRLTRVTGADLVLPLCAAASREKHSIFLIGSTFPSLAAAARRLAALMPALDIGGIYAPSFAFLASEEEQREAIAVIRAARPAIVFVALGAPKQELWADKVQHELNAAIICVGAGVDFIAGTVIRAPRFMRRLGMEWLWRAASEPRRLGRRYARIVLWLPALIIEHLRALRHPTSRILR